MRLITSLIIASAVGSVAVGGVKSYLGRTEENPVRTVADLYRSDRKAATRLIEQATLSCMPELEQIKTPRARNLVARIVVLGIATAQDGKGGMTDEKKRDLMTKEIMPALNGLPDDELVLLGEIVKGSRGDKSRIVDCVSRTVVELSAERATKETRPILSDAELRGS